MELRSRISDFIEKGEFAEAYHMLARKALGDAAFYEYPWLAKELAKCLPQPVEYRIGVLSTYTLGPIRDVLCAVALAQGFALNPYFGGFQQLEQEIMLPESGLVRHKPHAIIIAWRLADLSPLLWHSRLDLMDTEVQGEIADVLSRAKGLFEACKANLPQAQLMVHTFVPPAYPVLGVIDCMSPQGHRQTLDILNAELRRLAANTKGVHLVDCDTIARRTGCEAWFSARQWYTAKAPLGPPALLALAYEYIKMVRALAGKTKKVLVTDLDNTLWGGVLGEDGLDGIALGSNYPGNAYVAFQQEIRMLSRRGVVLCINSKNNETDVSEVFEKHKHMVVDYDDFAAVRINWQDKATNMIELAEELSLGLDSFVFVDDNPYELEMIRRRLPEVTVVEVPGEPCDLPGLLARVGYFDTVIYSDDDRKRGKFYRAQAKRAKLQRTHTDLEAFYRSLSMRLTVYDVEEAETPRVAQLTQRTNQFNMSTRRYGESDIKHFRDSPAYLVRAYRLEDRFGDNGIISVVIVNMDGKTWYVDTFLMSCRVIGRAVETAILALLIQEAKEAQAAVLVGDFLPTKKNIPARDVYAQHGFEKVEESSACNRWRIELANACLEIPDFFNVINASKKAKRQNCGQSRDSRKS